MKILRKILKIGFILTTIFLIGVTGAYLYAYLSPEIQIKNANAFVMYDNAETVFYQGSGSQEWTELEQISDTLIQATIYTEDKHFYNHHGFDILRIIKALYTNFISGKTVQGASTISQQYAKNLFLDFDKTWERKWKEMWITLRLETHYSKDEILEGYLNTINYGHGMYGIGNASYFYFGKSPKDLTLAESAMLVGIPKSPSNYSPISNYDLAKQRQRYVLNTLVNNGMISKEESNQAYAEKLTIIGEKSENDLSKIMYYQDAVMKELKTIKAIPEDLMETGGLKIYTNLDMETQLNMVENVQNTLAVEDELQTASVMMEAKTGKVIALMGGKDYNTSQYNRAISSKRQVGSAMKPLLYYAALENGFTSSTSFLSQATTFTFANNKTYSPQNYGEVYANKPISLAAAIAYSDNIYAVKTHMFLGEETLVDISKRLGITEELEAIPSLPLGTASISMLEMLTAYGCFASSGYLNHPYFIEKVTDLNGNVLYEHTKEETLVLNPSLTFILSELLTGTYDQKMIDYTYPTALTIANILTRKVSIKSGTTNTDHWSIGYNPDVVTAVWIGYDDNRNLDTSQYKYSRNIWANVMETYMSKKDPVWYDIPNNVSGVLVNPITGKPATENDKNTKIMYYIKGTEPTDSDPVFDEIEGTNFE